MLSRVEPLDLSESIAPLYLIGVVALRLAAKVGSSLIIITEYILKDILRNECVIIQKLAHLIQAAIWQRRF